MKTYIKYFLGLSLLVQACSASSEKKQDTDPKTLPWQEIEALAQGSTVQMMMWQGDPYINAYMKDYVIPEVKKRYDLNLQISSGQGKQIVSVLRAELEAGKDPSELDMIWINGETFYQLRQMQALYGPFVEKLPNSKLINLDNPFIGVDFQQKIEGYECPWGNVQLALIYDRKRVQDPPRSRAELAEYVEAHPGKFTIPNEFTGMTFLKSLLIDLAGGPDALAGDFDPARYEQYATELWAYINRIKPYFWKEGRTFPESLAATHQMFAQGELDFTMSNNDSEVDNKVIQGLFPKSTRSYVLDGGTIQNSHFLGIVQKGKNKAGAMLVINFLISPEAQYRKMNPEIWGDGTVLDFHKLDKDWQAKFQNIPQRKYAPKRALIQSKALMELAPEYMIRIYEDFRKEVIEK